jgi:hypothetical protein
MNEPIAPSVVPPPAPQPSKLPAWAIVLIVFVVLCCCSIGAIGLILAFGGGILQELGLYTLLPLLGILS